MDEERRRAHAARVLAGLVAGAGERQARHRVEHPGPGPQGLELGAAVARGRRLGREERARARDRGERERPRAPQGAAEQARVGAERRAHEGQGQEAIGRVGGRAPAREQHDRGDAPRGRRRDRQREGAAVAVADEVEGLVADASRVERAQHRPGRPPQGRRPRAERAALAKTRVIERDELARAEVARERPPVLGARRVAVQEHGAPPRPAGGVAHERHLDRGAFDVEPNFTLRTRGGVGRSDHAAVLAHPAPGRHARRPPPPPSGELAREARLEPPHERFAARVVDLHHHVLADDHRTHVRRRVGVHEAAHLAEIVAQGAREGAAELLGRDAMFGGPPRGGAGMAVGGYFDGDVNHTPQDGPAGVFFK